MSETTNALGAFLRARRTLVTPRQAGIPESGARRVPGLRREEVAMLAGISADYYLRLERGRDRNPSVQVLESIGRVLQLDDEHTAHLLSLAAAAPRRRRPRARMETVPPGALKLLDSMAQPAFIEGRYFDILAANSLARAVSPRFDVGGNQLKDMFLDPDQQSFHPEWEAMTECFVASLRQAVGSDIDDPRFIDLTGELSLASPRFRQLWARHEVRGQTGTPIRMMHPQVGELTLNRDRLAITGTDNLMLVVYHPDAGSTDADKLAILASAGLPTRSTRAGKDNNPGSSPGVTNVVPTERGTGDLRQR
ncbi:putative transcriptional regulator [Frankia canadensis]|uniref:Putative transcriptional regulator n=1 Tax=Frankia canadensis TaxID=1836972 RepID=A0A2I2KWR8_9ACTN|nr:helix-turn-helix transcriptional regulator [Frankia canadensis]SNQ50100.1 putative transcriptional regulator [Frankia canadensis]SOU57390.1 putative transcriptional regulator [Frankia canadensis]